MYIKLKCNKTKNKPASERSGSRREIASGNPVAAQEIPKAKQAPYLTCGL